ncbi:MAG: DUF2490 domain-containing protein [Bacteroidota bacterium]
MIVLVLNGRFKAQYYDDDARLRLNVNLEKSYKNGMEYQLVLQNRLNNNMSEYHGYATAGIAYKFNKHFKLFGGYVAGGQRAPDGNYSLIQQVYGGVTLKQKINKFTLVYRNLTQSQVKGETPFRDQKTPTTFNRNKFTLKYQLNKRWQVYASAEMYFTLSNKQKYATVGRTRNNLGLVYKLSKTTSIEPYFLYQKKNNFKDQSARHFIYCLTLNREF